MSKKGSSSNVRGRSAVTGRFIPIKRAKSDPKHTVIEHIPPPKKKG